MRDHDPSHSLSTLIEGYVPTIPERGRLKGDWPNRVLHELSRGMGIVEACAAAGVTRQSVTVLDRDDEIFRALHTLAWLLGAEARQQRREARAEARRAQARAEEKGRLL